MPRQFLEAISDDDYDQWAENCFLRSLEAKNIVDAAIWEEASWSHLVQKEVNSESSRRTNIEGTATSQVERRTKHVGSVRLRTWNKPIQMVAH